MRIASISIGAFLLGLSDVSAEQSRISLTPLTCMPIAEDVQPVSVPEDAALLVCSDTTSEPDVLIVTDPDVSWPILLGDNGTRSLHGYLLGAMHSFGAGLLYFDSEDDGVWVATDSAGSSSYVISLTGNDPLTLERKRAFLAVPADPIHAASLHISLGEALDRLLAL